MQPVGELPKTWTFADLQALPDDVDWRRYEIVDGSLVVSPSTDFRHEVVSMLVRDVLSSIGRPEFITVGPMAVDLHPSYRIPDLLVVSSRLMGTDFNPMRVRDVVLVVEVVSPGSVTTDRITKPAQYAAAGIPAYWRVETRPDVTLTAYALRQGAAVYTEIGTWGAGETAHLTEPFAVDVAIDAITPPPPPQFDG